MKVWDWQGSSPTGSILPPVDLASIAASIRAAEGECRIEDLRFARTPLESYLRLIDEFQPDGVILNLTTTSAEQDYMLIGVTPRGVARICFGAHAIACADEAIARGVDHILVGDPEVAVAELMRTLPAQHPAPGVWSAGGTRNAPVFTDDLDAITLPSPNELKLDAYRMPFATRGAPFWLIQGSRGGPSSDDGSVHALLFGAVRRERSIKGICDEIESMVREAGVRFIRFLDPVFNTTPDRVQQFCAEVRRRELRFHWAAEFDAGMIDSRIAKQLADAGLSWVCFSLSDCPGAQESDRDGAVGALSDAANALHSHGIRVGLTLRLSGRGEADQRRCVDRFMAELQRIGPDAVQCQLTMPVPGSEFRSSFDQSKLDQRWSSYDPFGAALPYSAPVNLVSVRRSIHLNWLLAHPMRAVRLAGSLAPSFVRSAGIELFRRDLWPDRESKQRKKMLAAAEKLEMGRVFATRSIAEDLGSAQQGGSCGSHPSPGGGRLVQLGIIARSSN